MTILSRISEPQSPGQDRVEIASKGARLAGTLFLPVGKPRVVMVLHGAVGVPQRSYRHFANWLAAERGMACMTYDYRDFGASASDHLRKSRASLTDWGFHDQEAALDAAEARFPGIPLWVLGHSLGGSMLPFHRPRQIERAIVLAAGLVRMSDHPWPYQALARQFWYVSGPAATSIAGYLPGQQIGFGANLPAGVFWQWRRWCTNQQFYLGDAGRQLPSLDPTAVTAATRLIAIADDVMVPEQAVWRLMALMPQAYKRQKVLRPSEFGLSRIGHLGAFAAASAALWPAIVDEN